MSPQLCLILAFFPLFTSQLWGHGWSEAMRRELNAAAPEWLVVTEPIKAELVRQAVLDTSIYRPISGDSHSTRSRVTLPGHGIVIEVDYPISWYRGSSLSPDGTKLIINSGTESRAYEILNDGQYHQIELQLPHVTYDAGPKGFISGWSWAGNHVLVGEAEVNNEKGEFIEKRIYIFNVKEKTLSRLDVSAVNLSSTEGLTVTKVSSDLNGMCLSLGDADFAVMANLKSPPKPLQ